MQVISRTMALMLAMGWQGGTIHQVAEVTGCCADDLLYTEDPKYNDVFDRGWFAYRTCSFEHNQRFLTSERGNLFFWLGVAAAVQMSLKMGDTPEKKF